MSFRVRCKNALSDRPIYFLLPALIVFFIVTFLPTVVTLYYSFTNYNIQKLEYNFVGFRNYAAMLKDSIFVGATKNTLILTFCVAIIQNVFSLYLAVILNNKHFHGRNFARVIIYIPVLLSQMVPRIHVETFAQPKPWTV